MVAEPFGGFWSIGVYERIRPAQLSLDLCTDFKGSAVGQAPFLFQISQQFLLILYKIINVENLI